nr:MAG TPA: hypothetical protein [Caudoviricetes sp.]
MTDNFNKMIDAIYGWSIENGEIKAPKPDLPKEVTERVDYFLEMIEDGLTLLGLLDFIFSDKKPADYDFGASKDWLPKSKEFDEWVGIFSSLAQMAIATYIIFGDAKKEKTDDAEI